MTNHQPDKSNYVLGIWDGHDAGAALLQGDRILCAVNEERLSRRKLEVGFPARSIEDCLRYANIPPDAVSAIAVSTSDPAKTLTRLAPRLKEEYYLLRRRKMPPKPLDVFRKGFKYRFTELGPNRISRYLSRLHIARQLDKMGLNTRPAAFIDHHLCHAEAAARCSGFAECLVVTLDGVGDGLSGTVWRFADSELTCLKRIPSTASLGIFFEHVTNLMNMRELEDEGKVMALANYAYPVADKDNPMMALMHTEGLDIVPDVKSRHLFRELKKILWRYPSEQFAFMAQRVLEKNALALTRLAVSQNGSKDIALAGGVFSNIKLNMKVAELADAERVFVFPHMGDGGLALGAAIHVNNGLNNIPACRLDDLYLGAAYSKNTVLSALQRSGRSYKELENAPGKAAELILGGEIILWFQGRMEFGPRALGNRSILARPDRPGIKDRLNLVLKKRVWYQPFCPSMLLEDAESILNTDGRDLRTDRFMTSAFHVREAHRPIMAAVMNIDGTCRPQFVGDENPVYRDLLRQIKKTLGRGVVLNTSFNIHGEPMVCSPDDALDMFERTEVKYLFLGDYLVEK